jgi:hypothetical protein
MKKDKVNPFSTTGRPEQQIRITDDFAEALEAQDEAFRNKFGRDPDLEDPIFFNPDADQPQFPAESQRWKAINAMCEILLKAGVDPDFAFAFRKTGLLLTEENVKYSTPTELAKWNDAIDEYRSNIVTAL